MEKKIKQKLHVVAIGEATFYVLAATKQGALTTVIEFLSARQREDAVVEVASYEQAYAAGKSGATILGDKSAPASVDTAQLALPVGDAPAETFAAGTAFDPAHPDNAAWKAQGDYAGTIAAPDTRVVVEAKHPEAIGS